MTITTEIEIDAPAEKVWAILTDFPAFPSWNPFIRQIAGNAAAGERLRVQLQPDGSKAMTFQPTILAAMPNRELRWLGRLFLPGVFDGEHKFRIETLGSSRVRFVQEEQFRGILVGLFGRSLETGTKAGFEAMNLALKKRSEQN